MKTVRFLTAFVALICLATVGLHAEDKPDGGGWSADLLTQILKADAPKPENTTGAPATPAAAPGELVLRTYQLTHLRIGEAGKAQAMLNSLQHLLPAGSAINPDVPANSLHVLTTAAAHKDFHDIITALDVPEAKSPLSASAMPEDMKAMVKKLADTGDQSGKLASAITSLKTDVANQVESKMATIDARQRQQTMRIMIGGAAVLLIVLVVLIWAIRRKPTAPSDQPAVQSTEIVLQPDQLTTALMPAHDNLRTSMLGALNEVAIKLQAQHNEQQKLIAEQHRQLEEARHAMIGQSEHVTQALSRIEDTTSKLEQQNNKIEEIATEWQRAVKELDETKDELTKSKIELEQERAKIAALSMLLEEGQLPPALPPTSTFNNTEVVVSNDNNGTQSPSAGAAQNLISAPLPPCNQDQVQTIPKSKPVVMAAPRFQFLPPDHPES